MKAKPKAANPQRFLWHLTSWRSFSHDHWWTGDDAPSRVAALWEVVRRHPHTETLLQRIGVEGGEPNNELERFIADSALKSWQTLTDGERVDWREALAHLPPQRGFDPRPIYDVTAQSVHLDHATDRNACLVLDPKLQGQARAEAEAAREREIARLAVEHHKAGRILIAIEPDVSDVDNLQKAVVMLYAQHRRKHDYGRGRVLDWLNVIREFEDAELKPQKNRVRDKTLFARYRKIIVGTRW